MSNSNLLETTHQLGKFEGTIKLAEVLHGISEYADEEDGSVQDNGEWAAFFQDLNDLDETKGQCGEMVCAILTEDLLGFVDCQVFETLQEGEREWELVKECHNVVDN